MTSYSVTLADGLNIIAWTIAAGIGIPSLVLIAELLAALPRSRKRSGNPHIRPSVSILIPAHNESSMIGACVAGVRTQLTSADRILVVADNCSDDTASLARQAGAEVIERFDTARRGKGFALDFGVNHLQSKPPEVVIVVDADVTLRPGSIDALAMQVIDTGNPAQAVYVLRPPADAKTSDAISHLAFTVRNHIRARGLNRIARVCPLFGSGMAFPWHIISRANLATNNIVEDLTLGLDLAMDRTPALLCEQARVDGTLVSLHAAGDALSQRRRWEHGHLRTVLQCLPRFMWNAVRRDNLRALALAMDVMIPPLSLMVIGTLVGLVGLSTLALIGASWIPALFVAGVMVTTGTLMLVNWINVADREYRFALRAIPAYVLRKIPIYLGFLRGGESHWIRASRPASAPPTNNGKPAKPTKRAA